jgi:pyruvate, orthophosphate dikinase
VCCADDLKEVVQRYKGVYKREGLVLPEDPYAQLRAAICAVFRSWNTPRAVKYREINKVTGLRGTAVNIQAMVYGNFNAQSCTGVCFTRNPATGEHALYGEFLVNAQGEDVVAGAPCSTRRAVPSWACRAMLCAALCATCHDSLHS